MTSSKQDDNKVEDIAINSDLVRHSEYDIEANDNDDIAIVHDAGKLVIDPTYVENTIEFRKNKNTLLAIPVKDIEDISVISNPQASSGKDSPINNLSTSDTNMPSLSSQSSAEILEHEVRKMQKRNEKQERNKDDSSGL